MFTARNRGTRMTTFLRKARLCGVTCFFILGLAILSVSCNSPPSDNFILQVQIRDDQTGERLARAEVVFDVSGKVHPAIYSDVHGKAIVEVDESYADRIIIITVSKEGYASQSRFVQISPNALPIVYRLNALPNHTPSMVTTKTPTSIPTDNTLLYIIEKTPESINANTYKLSIDELGYGTLNISLPISLTLGQSDFIRLEITPDEELESLSTVAVPITLTVSSSTIEQPEFYIFTDKIQIYSIMMAELTGADSSIEINTQSDDSRKHIRPGTTVAWTWLITPKISGRVPLVLRLSIPAVVDSNQDGIVELLKDVPLYLQVSTPIPPTSTPSPIPTTTPSPTPTPGFIQETSGSIAQNPVPLIVGVLTIIGVLFGAYLGSPLVVEHWKNRNHDLNDKNSISGRLAKDIISTIKETDDIDQLKVWLFDEQRKTVIDALNDRIRILQSLK